MKSTRPGPRLQRFRKLQRLLAGYANSSRARNIVVDTTGNDAFVPALAMVAEELGKPLVSGALYRGGSVARVQRQVLAGDTPIHRREDGPQYPVIPGGDGHGEFATPALGCSAPVNNAPPASVMGCAALIAQW